jgi:uncharacterized protein (TIGR03437 family)
MSNFRSTIVRFFFAFSVLSFTGAGLLLATAPVIDGLDPNSGPAGTAVGIELDQPSSITAVYFGSTSVSFQQQNSTHVDVNVPTGSGSVYVSVVDSSSNTSANTANDLFTYTDSSAPSITDAAPNEGPSSGGTMVYIYGNNFSSATEVLFGNIQSEGFTVVNSGTIHATSPPGYGYVDIRVVNPDSTSVINLAYDGFYYTGGSPLSNTITFGALSNQNLGVPPITVSATATSGDTVSFASTTTSVCTVSGSLVTLVATGTCSITASDAGNSEYAAATNVSQSFTVLAPLTSQTITFGSLSNQTYGVSPFSLSASSTSGLTVSFASTTMSVCTVSGTTLTVVGGGTCSITASQAGNGTYAAATDVTQSFTVNPASQTITFGTLSNQTYGVSPITLSASSTSSLTVSFASTTMSVCTVSGTTLTVVGGGTCSITASQAGNANYSAASQVTRSFTVMQASQTITFGALSNQTYGVSPISLTGSSNSSLTLTYTSSTLSVCTVSGSTVTVVGVGTCSITASQAGNANYSAASSVMQSFTVSQASQTITFGALSNQNYGVSPISLTGTSNSSLTLTYTSTTLSVCTVSGSTVTVVGVGTCSITASQAGNADYSAATSVMQSFTVSQGSQTITFGSLSNQSYGVVPFTLSGSSNSSLALTYTSTTLSVCTVSGSLVTLVGVGACSITASQAGNADYSAATPVMRSFTVSQGSQTITFTGPGNQSYGASVMLSGSVNSGLPLSYASTTPSVCTVSGNTVTAAGTGTCSITASQTGSADYTAATPVSQSFTVTAAAQTITFGALPNMALGSAPFALSASSSSGLPVTFSTSTPAVCAISGSTVTVLATGTCSISASQAGNANYSAAPSVTRSFSSSPASQTITFTPPGNQANGASNITLNATASSGLPVAYTSNTPAVCNVSGNMVITIGAGTCSITITQAGNANYAAAPPVTFSFFISARSQTISFSAVPNQASGAGAFQLFVTSSSGLPITITSNTPSVCSVSGSIVTPLTAGLCSITASQAGGQGYAAANPVTRTFSIAAAPLSVSSVVSLGEYVLGSNVSTTLAASGGLPPYHWSCGDLPPGMTLNASSGALSGTPSAPGSYDLTIVVADSQSPPATAQFSVTVSVFGIGTSTLPAATVTVHYSQSLSAAGGVSPYSFTASGLPAGLSLSSSGVLSGIPTATGSFTLAVQVTDSAGKSFSENLTLVVNSLPAPLTITGGPLTGGIVATAYSANLSATGGVTPIVWSLIGGSLPPGLYLTGSSAVIQGLPKTAGTYSFTLQAADSNGALSSATYSIVISPASLTLSVPSSFPIGIVGVDYPEQILTASGGTAPYAFTVTGPWPAGLTLENGQFNGIPTAAGSYAFTITVTDASGKTANAPSSILIHPPEADLVISQSMVSFLLTIGSGSVASHATVTVRSSVVQKLLNYSISVSPPAPWLDVTGGGTTPGTVEITVAPSALSLLPATAPYQTTISVSCAAPSPCAGSVHTITVSLQVSALVPQLSSTSSLISFQASSPASLSQPFGIQNTGGGTLSITAVTPADPWLSVSGVPESLAAGPPAFFGVTADPTGMATGYYHSSILISSSAGSIDVPVSLSIPPSMIMSLFPGGTQIQTESGVTPGVTSGAFQVSVTGSSAASWTAAVQPGAPWLKVTSPSGQATNSTPGNVAFSIDPVLSAALPAGAHYGTIRVSSSDVADTPLDFDVILDVASTGAPIQPSLSPAGLIFVATAGSALAGQSLSQTVQVSASADSAQNYQAYPYTVDGAPWLSISQTVSTVSSTAPSNSMVSVNPAGLAPGVYRGIVSYALSSQAVRSVNVTLIVQPAQPAPAPGAVASATPAACTSATLIPTQMGLVDNFEQPIGWLTPLSVLVLDNCGSPVTNSQVIASFSSGEQPIILTPVDSVSGIYSGAWTPRSVSPQLNVTTQATAPGFTPASTKVTGQVVPSMVPVLAPAGILNLFNAVLGAALAPGTAIQVYGANLSPQTAAASTIPLPDSLAGTSVSIGGLPAPLYYVSPGQIDAQIPFSLAPGDDYQVQINSGGILSTVGFIHISRVAPGLVAEPSNLVIAQHLDYTLVSETSPAAPGEYLMIYLVGLGATNIPVREGAASPFDPLAYVSTPATVTVDGNPATVSFAGLAPGSVGLYQIDFQVPQNARNGDLALSVSQGAVQANSAILPVKQPVTQ